MSAGAAFVSTRMRTAAHEALAPKYAHVERERRFLVDPALCPDLAGLPHILIEDRYLIGTRMRLRRMTDSATGETSLKLTKKYDSSDPLARPIVTAYLSGEEHAVLETLPAASLTKQRYPVETDQGTFGVDRFGGPLTGLLLAEIECDDDLRLRALVPPGWAIREVSHDPRFQGAHLAGLQSLATLDLQLARG